MRPLKSVVNNLTVVTTGELVADTEPPVSANVLEGVAAVSCNCSLFGVTDIARIVSSNVRPIVRAFKSNENDSS